MAIDLSLLPAPEVIEALGFESILAEYKADFVARYPDAAVVIDLESEPVVKLLEVGAYRETLLRARYNDEARALLLAYATGADLDHLGVTYYDEARLLITAADPLPTPPVEAVWEADADYRNRLVLKPESYSVAGPTGAYLFHALSASGLVKSAAVTSPQGGSTEVFILSRTGNGVPDAPLLDIVEAALSSESIRPLSEEVIVSAGAVVDYALDVDLILFPGPAGEIVLAAAQAALDALAVDRHKLDGDVIKSAIDAAAHQPGVKKVVINSPAADVVCGPGQAPWCTGITVTIAGVEP
jgi:phage-related baseplate assembly protein